MKLLFTLSFFFIVGCCIAQERNARGKLLTLKAKRNNYTYTYTLGSALKIIYVSEERNTYVKGRLTKASYQGIYVSPFHKKETMIFIATDSIFAIKKLFRKTRTTTGIIMGATVIAGSVLGNNLDNNPLGTSIEVLAILPGLISFYTFTGSYIFELFDKRSIKNGWIFKVE